MLTSRDNKISSLKLHIDKTFQQSVVIFVAMKIKVNRPFKKIKPKRDITDKKSNYAKKDNKL
jgi:hypothetical protein